MLSDWESSLTELSDSEDEYQPAPSKKKKQKPPPEYKVTGSLQPYRTTTYTTRSLYDQIIDGTIDLDPEYQRANNASHELSPIIRNVKGVRRIEERYTPFHIGKQLA
ncbi:hypothetical protein GSI_05222 [Ganoderma sinense ZZ0214-1]|uniref:Uncharacterized protein n=1 Tax=Ganoderma sinense ZZ0214-1 TaxID=1077348 RepID=A0A2G8SFH2_9APHY|nr:hypothetical protein GSI_05222 [Ganoderma sinense ZZ0214-1]